MAVRTSLHSVAHVPKRTFDAQWGVQRSEAARKRYADLAAGKEAHIGIFQARRFSSVPGGRANVLSMRSRRLR